MKLKTFNQSNVPSTTRMRKVPVISFSSKSGVFRFNTKAVDLTKVTIGHQIEFLQDEEKPSAWYMSICDKDGFLIYDKKGLTFNNCSLAKHLIADIKDSDKVSNYQVEIIDQSLILDGRTYWPLVIKPRNDK